METSSELKNFSDQHRRYLNPRPQQPNNNTTLLYPKRERWQSDANQRSPTGTCTAAASASRVVASAPPPDQQQQAPSRPATTEEEESSGPDLPPPAPACRGAAAAAAVNRGGSARAEQDPDCTTTNNERSRQHQCSSCPPRWLQDPIGPPSTIRPPPSLAKLSLSAHPPSCIRPPPNSMVSKLNFDHSSPPDIVKSPLYL